MVLATSQPDIIVKRDGRVVPFQRSKVFNALYAALSWQDKPSETYVEELVDRVINLVSLQQGNTNVEQVQDACEITLQSAGEFAVAKHFILYRANRAQARSQAVVPSHIKESFDFDRKYFPTPIQEFQFYDKYSKFDYNLQRRETWSETVDRATNYLCEIAQSYQPLHIDQQSRLRRAIGNMEAMPSMRLLAQAGAAARRDNVAIYNCSFLPVDDIESFVENMHICMAGCGVGYSVESIYVDKLPRVSHQRGFSPYRYIVDDTSRGWADALRYGLNTWFDGLDVIFDTSGIRPSGTPLRTKGGRASGPQPLERLLDFCRSRILARQGKQLRTIDAHDLMCEIGRAVVSGGVRRTAMISLFDEDDLEMLHCKDGDFDRHDAQRWNANNSMVWTDPNVTQKVFMDRFKSMLDSERGEPGIFNRWATLQRLPTRRNKDHAFGTNPCGEIVLRPYQFCNLSIAVARSNDTYQTLKDKVEVAAIIGTIQSLATHFPNLRPQWKANSEEERLTGVDITGQYDAKHLLTSHVMQNLREHAIETNKLWSDHLGINQSASVTTVKPSGNSAQLLNCSSGIHPRWAPYYIRNVRVSATSPIAKVLQECGVPLSPENGEDVLNPRTWVVSFPMKAPDNVPTRNNVSAIDQCNFWLQNKLYWTEHNPSVTITYTPNEVLDITKWVWDHRDKIGGMAFLPRDEAKYDQLPYIEITEEEYIRRAAEFPQIDFSLVYKYDDRVDNTTAAQELACVAGVCEIP